MVEEKKDLPKPPEEGATENIFGGKNPSGLYVPLTSDEMDALDRMIQSKDIQLIIHGWSVLENPQIKFGDLRARIDFRLDFTYPEKPVEVHYFDLELKVRNSNIVLFKKRMPVIQNNGKPLLVQAGMFIDLAWDIAIDHIDPNLVKMYLPGVRGLTSTRLDKDSGDRTLTGNMKLTQKQLNHLSFLEEQNKKIRQKDANRVIQLGKGKNQ